ncbi:isopenicillin N synthase family dioxygenase [Plesiocystis pacifica]|uniref:isopenicillin N synthase family dioxygenase n=1 Tax=Plesiocystis pacifica TaxID=191768 RepID=UPI0005D47A73|nr:2OG-Fe(II) oxygenase family protein [Plesiocystis pacifica]
MGHSQHPSTPSRVPELDLRDALAERCSPEALDALALELRAALSGVGFVTVAGALEPAQLELAAELRALSRALFRLPAPQKQALAMVHSGLAWRGWFALGDELTAGLRDQKEGYYLGVEHPDAHPLVRAGAPMHGRNPWPPGPAFERFPAVVAAWMAHMRRVCELLMSLVARGLGLAPDYFARRFGDEPTELFRIFRYPPRREADPDAADATDAAWGVGEHTDMGFLTALLIDGSPGLEVQDLDGRWLPVRPEPGRLVVNVGDMLEVWTRGVYRATPHRVRNDALAGERLSWPYFFDPGWRQPLDPIPRAELSALGGPSAGSGRRRWDGLELASVPPGTRYGDFVWAKISGVFPELARAVEGRPESTR